MFNNPRYKTNGIDSTLSEFMQFLLWEMIDNMNVKKDYLQIFNLIPIQVNGITVQKIIHTQEQPVYENIVVLNNLTVPINTKIYVIDDGEQTTMMLASER